jgi:hypothetical protein
MFLPGKTINTLGAALTPKYYGRRQRPQKNLVHAGRRINYVRGTRTQKKHFLNEDSLMNAALDTVP